MFPRLTQKKKILLWDISPTIVPTLLPAAAPAKPPAHPEATEAVVFAVRWPKDSFSCRSFMTAPPSLCAKDCMFSLSSQCSRKDLQDWSWAHSFKDARFVRHHFRVRTKSEKQQ